MEKVIVRKARSSDKKAVTDFCSRIWEGWDYLPRVWDQWLEDDQGAFLVAELAGQPVGTDKISVLSPGEVWLEGLRVDPRHHRQGIARALNRRAMEIVAGLEPTTVRFSTAFDNQASRHMGEQDGFRLLLRCQPMYSEPLEGELPSGLRGRDRDIDEILAYMKTSSVFKKMKGLFAWGWAFKNIDRPLVEKIGAEGGALLVRKEGGIGGLALYLRQRHGPKVTLGFIDGGQQEVLSLARWLRAAAHREGCPEIIAMVPEEKVSVLSAGGFRQEEPVAAVVYQLSGERLKKVLQKVRRRG